MCARTRPIHARRERWPNSLRAVPTRAESFMKGCVIEYHCGYGGKARTACSAPNTALTALLCAMRRPWAKRIVTRTHVAHDTLALTQAVRTARRGLRQDVAKLVTALADANLVIALARDV